MTKSIVIKTRKKTSFFEVMNQNNSFFFLVFCLLLGLLFGVMIFKFKNSGGNFYSSEFKNIYNGLSGGFWQVLQNSATELLPFAAITFLSGTCMVGSVLVPFILAARGVFLGFAMGYAYSAFSLSGIVFNLLIFIPAAVISSFALVLSGREAFGFSLSLARLAFPGKKATAVEQDFKLYCMRQLFLLSVYAAAVFTKTIMAVSFLSFFNLQCP